MDRPCGEGAAAEAAGAFVFDKAVTVAPVAIPAPSPGAETIAVLAPAAALDPTTAPPDPPPRPAL